MGLPLGLPLGLGEPFFHFRRYIKNVLILYVLLVSIPLFLEKTPNPPGFTFWVYLWVYVWVYLLGLPFKPKPSWVYLTFWVYIWVYLLGLPFFPGFTFLSRVYLSFPGLPFFWVYLFAGLRFLLGLPFFWVYLLGARASFRLFFRRSRACFRAFFVPRLPRH